MSKQAVQVTNNNDSSTPSMTTYVTFTVSIFAFAGMLLLLSVCLAAIWPEKFVNEGEVPPVYVWGVDEKQLSNRVQMLSDVLQDNGYHIYLDGQPYESADEFDSTNTTLVFNTDENRIDYITDDALYSTLQPLGYLFCDADGNPVELDKTISQLMVLGYKFSIYPTQKMVVVSRNSRYHGNIRSYQTITEASVDIKDLVHDGDTVYKYLFQ